MRSTKAGVQVASASLCSFSMSASLALTVTECPIKSGSGESLYLHIEYNLLNKLYAHSLLEVSGDVVTTVFRGS